MRISGPNTRHTTALYSTFVRVNGPRLGNCAHGWTDPNSGAYRQREGVQAHEARTRRPPPTAHPPPPALRPRTGPLANNHVYESRYMYHKCRDIIS